MCITWACLTMSYHQSILTHIHPHAIQYFGDHFLSGKKWVMTTCVINLFVLNHKDSWMETLYTTTTISTLEEIFLGTGSYDLSKEISIHLASVESNFLQLLISFVNCRWTLLFRTWNSSDLCTTDFPAAVLLIIVNELCACSYWVCLTKNIKEKLSSYLVIWQRFEAMEEHLLPL